MSDLRLSKLGKDTVLYGMGGVAGKSLNILLLPVLTRLFSLDEYGEIDLITVVITLITAVSVMGVDSAIGVYYFDNTRLEDRRQYFASYVWAISGASVVFSIFGMLLAPVLADNFLKTPNSAYIFRIACLTIPAASIYQASITLARFEFKAKLYNVLVILNMVLNVALAIIFVKYLAWHIAGVFAARICAGLTIAAIGIALQRDAIFVRPSLTKLRRLLSYGIPLIPIALITYSSNAVGRIFLKLHWTDAAIGKYAFATKIGAIAGIAFSAFNLAFLPFAAKHRFNPDFSKQVNRAVKTYLAVAGIAIGMICAFSKPLILLFGTREYLVAEPYISLGMVILMLNATFQIFNIGVCYAKKTIYITLSQLVALATNLSLNWFLVPRFEVMGAMIAFIASLLSANVIIFALSQKVYPIKYDTHILFEQLTLILCMSILFFRVTDLLPKLCIVAIYSFWSIRVRKYIDPAMMRRIGNKLIFSRQES